MGDTRKVLLIGWDAADWKIINELVDDGKMPTLKGLIEEGVMGNIRTLSPVLSPMLWTSIATGKRPYKHGIYGFTEPAPNGNGVQPMTNVSRTSKAIWNILNQHDLQSIVVGWWPSHPAEPINGVMVSDFFHKVPKKPNDAWPLQKKCVHPAERLEEIGEFRVHPLEMTPEDILPFVPRGAEIDQQVDSRVSAIMKVTAECSSVHAAATYLLENDPWDFAAIYYDAIDHYCHGFMKYRAPQQAHISDQDFAMYQHVVTTGYIYHDMMLKRLLELAGEDTTVILVSDHGFHPDHLRPSSLPAEPAGPALEHRDFGIFVAKGPGIKKDHMTYGASLLDVAPTVLRIYDLPVGEDMDGAVLSDIFEEEPESQTIPSWEEVPGNDGQHPADMVIDPQETQEALEQLIALGYIERPHEDSGKAVQQCTRELDYNLARAYMDADMYGEAIPLLYRLYQQHPLEFRFGIQLANCLRVMGRHQDLKGLIQDLNERWRKAAVIAREKIKQVAEIAKERRDHWKRLKAIDDENTDPAVPRLARVNIQGKPILFDDAEQHSIRQLRSIARGNPQTLDFLAATVAMSEGDFESALQFMEKARLTQSVNPGFRFHVGNVYLSLNRLEDAEASFLKGLELDEYHPNCLMGLSRCYLEMGRTGQAQEYAQRAIGLKYHFPVAHYYLGRARYQVKDYEGAIKSLNTAIEQNPNFVEAHETLAKIYRQALVDQPLAEFHQAAARKLGEENQLVLEETEPLEFRTFSEEEFSDLLPKILETSDNEHFVRCLSQPRTPASEEDSEQEKPEVIVVSGLPRTGTSMMMQMLKAGGVEIFTDNVRVPDESNPKGYYEADAVKQLATRNDWLGQCAGKAIKVVAPLVPYMPQDVRFKVIYMRREMQHVLGSQSDMLDRMGEQGGNIDDEQLARVFRQQSYFAVNLLLLHENPVLRLAYDEVVDDPASTADKLVEFLGMDLDRNAMVAAVDPALSRQKEKATN